MQTSIFIAQLLGLTYLVLGVGLLINRDFFNRMVSDFSRNEAFVFLGGLMALVIGIVLILIHNIWVGRWIVLITIIGWLAFLKGVWMIVFPDTVPRFMLFYEKNRNLATVHAVVALILGVILTYLGFFVR